jgi:predicted transcriptional regulator
MVGLPPSPSELKMLRKKANLTQKELAMRAGMSQALIARIEAGDVDPRVSTLRKILEVLNDDSFNKISLSSIMHKPVIVVNIDETIGKATEIMWKYGISQIPIINNGGIVGSLREESILKKFKEEKSKDVSNLPISCLLEESFPIVSIETNYDEVSRLLSNGNPAVLVSEHGSMVGIITKIDLIAKHVL